MLALAQLPLGHRALRDVEEHRVDADDLPLVVDVRARCGRSARPGCPARSSALALERHLLALQRGAQPRLDVRPHRCRLTTRAPSRPTTSASVLPSHCSRAWVDVAVAQLQADGTGETRRQEQGVARRSGASKPRDAEADKKAAEVAKRQAEIDRERQKEIDAAAAVEGSRGCVSGGSGEASAATVGTRWAPDSGICDSDERGLSYAFVGVSFMTVFTATTLAIDVGVYAAARNQAQRSAQAGALAGAAALAFSSDSSQAPVAVQRALEGAKANLGDGDSGLDSIIRRNRGQRRGRSAPSGEGLRLSNQRTAQPRSNGNECGLRSAIHRCQGDRDGRSAATVPCRRCGRCCE